MVEQQRTRGLVETAGVGVGAIVGGGIMVLAGVAFETTGPSAVVAFAVNGMIAFLTAMSFAEIASQFPASGGAYTFAKKVLSVRAAFGVGWILWFAYIVAGVLYAMGFAAFLAEGLREFIKAMGGTPPLWLWGRSFLVLAGTLATGAYAVMLLWKADGGKQWATIGKLLVFAILILGGIVGVVTQPVKQTVGALSPFFSSGVGGLIAAMGFTFIALQGFDLIAAIGGEVKDPERNIPRAMFLSLGTALIVYLPLLLLISTVGVEPGQNIRDAAIANGDTVFAVAVSRYLGTVGYWLVITAAILSTLSALQANLLAASRVSLSMARDRTLPFVIGQVGKRNTPYMSIYTSALTLVAILFMVKDLAGAGAAASLIFLVSFALTHLTAYLARDRSKLKARPGLYSSPYFPAVPVAGGVCCTALAIYQAVNVPDAGGIVLIWLGLGSILYVSLFRNEAETEDATQEALDPTLWRLRGKSPLVLVPVANPAHARSMIQLANALAPSEFARVLLLSIVQRDNPEEGVPEQRLADAQAVVREALTVSYAAGQSPEALITTAALPWQEIQRVADVRRCQSLLLGFGSGSDVDNAQGELESLLNRVDCDVAVLRASADWRLADAKRVLVPVGGRGEAHNMRAHFLGSICRNSEREITFVTVVPPRAKESTLADTLKNVSGLAEVKVPGAPRVHTIRHENVAEAIIEEAEKHDLCVLGLRSAGWRRRVFGNVVLRIAREAQPATVMLSRGERWLVKPFG